MKLKIIVMAICLFAILTIPSLNAMDDENSTFRENFYCEDGEMIPIESEGEVEDKLNAEELENELTTYDSVSNDELNSVEPENIIIPQVFNSNGSGEITLELPEGSTGQVSLYTKENDDMGNLILNVIMRNSPYSSNNKTITVNGLKIGDHAIRLVYEDDLNGRYIKEAYVTVPKISISEEIQIPKTVSSNTMNILFPNSFNGHISTTINGKSSNTEVKNGIATVNLNDLIPGSHSISIRYSGDDKYQSFEIKDYVFELKNYIKVNAGNLVTYYNSGLKYSITVRNLNDEPLNNVEVTFKINGKKVSSTKTKNGIATLTIKQLPNTYKITTEVLGNSITKKLTVKHVLQLQKVKIKKSSRKIVMKATLKQGKTFLKNKKIIFKFNGRKYVSKTNHKGVAKITIKKAMIKKLKTGKKITYSASYLKDTIKKKAIVKK